MFGTGVEELVVNPLFQERFSGHSAKGFVATCQAVLGGSDTHFMNFLPSFLSSLLHRCSKKIVGDDHHFQGLVGHCRGFDCEAIHAQGGFEVAELHFNLPAFHVEIGDFLGGVGLRVEEIGDNDEGRFFSCSIFITQFDVAQGQFIGEVFPLLVCELTGVWFFGRFFPSD